MGLQTDLTIKTVIGRTRLNVAASIVDIDAPTPKRNRGSWETLEGKIPTIKEAFDLIQDDYRALISLDSLPISQSDRKAELIRQLYNDVQNCATSVDK